MAEARVFVDAFSPSDAGKPASLEALDRAWAAWLGTNPTEGGEINKIINCVGMNFGSLLAAETGLEWVVATDGYETELALHGKVGDVLVYPANFVAKRWERREANFLKDACGKIIAEVQKTRADHRGARN